MNRLFICLGAIAIIWPVPSYADVYIYNQDGTVTEHLAQDFKSRAAPDVVEKLGAVMQRGEQYLPLVQAAAEKYDLPETLIMAVIAAESAFKPDALSVDGALGLMQLIPDTARDMGYDWYAMSDPASAIDAGSNFLSRLMKKYNGNVRLTLAGYNAGPGNVSKYGGVPPFPETEAYISAIEAILGPRLDGRRQDAESAPLIVFSQGRAKVAEGEEPRAPALRLKSDPPVEAESN